MPRLKEAAREKRQVAEPLALVPDEKPKAAAAAKGADEFGFATLDDTIDYLNVLIYGREGTGKTTALAMAANHAPKGSRVLVIAAEGGLKKVALGRRGVDTSKIVVWPDPRSGIQITAARLEALHERVLGQLMDEPGCWYAVGIDSISEIVQGIREQATDKRIAKMRRNPRLDQAEIDEDFVDRDDYGVMTNQLRKVTRKLRDLPCHVIFTALERVGDDGIVGPNITPALAADVLGYVDLALYFRATQHAAGEDEDEALAEFRALTRPGTKTRAKDRFDLTPRVLAEPDFGRILGYIQGDLTEDTDPVQSAYMARRQAEAQAKAEAAAEKQERKTAAKRGTRKATGAKAATGDAEAKGE